MRLADLARRLYGDCFVGLREIPSRWAIAYPNIFPIIIVSCRGVLTVQRERSHQIPLVPGEVRALCEPSKD
jgi:hypothetical protein